jgi:hypothetical protein
MQIKIKTKSVTELDDNRWFVEVEVLPENGHRFTQSAEATTTKGADDAVALAFEALKKNIERRVVCTIKAKSEFAGKEIKSLSVTDLHDKIRIAEDVKNERAVEIENSKQLVRQNREEY